MSSFDFEKLSLKKFKIDSILPDATILCLGRRRSGKCLAKNTSVLKYDGTLCLVQDVKSGDVLMGDDSRPRNVLATTRGTDTLYKVTHNTGQTYTVNSDHVLSLQYTEKNKVVRHGDIYRVHFFNQSTLQKDHVDFPLSQHTKALQFNLDSRLVDIPVTKYMKLPQVYKEHLHGYTVAVQFPTVEVPFDPYILGYLLGSTGVNQGHTHVVAAQNSCILQYIAVNLGKYKLYLDLISAKNCEYAFAGESDSLKVFEDWRVPQVYKCNSTKNRLEVLAGFLDAAASMQIACDTPDVFYKLEFHQDRAQLVDDIIFLAESVGLHTRKTCSSRLEIRGNVHSIPTKIKSRRSQNVDTASSCRISVEEQPPGEYYGFELDGNHRFVLGNFVVTHNSWLVRDMFFHHRHIPLGLLFSGTEEASPFFSDFIPDAFIHSEYDSSVVESVLNRQKRKIREAKLSAKSDTGKTPSNNIFIVLDDMLHDAQNWKREKTIKNIFFNGRHYNILFILTMQYPLGITPELRSNIDYVFVFNEPSLKNRRKIYDDYAGMIPSFDHFCNILDACTQDHECLVIKTSGNSNDLRDQVFWYKAEYHSNFQVGHPKLWEYHRINYNKDYEEEAENDQFAAEKLKKKFAKTKKLKVIVNREGEVVGYEHTDQ
jgi:hypothetical protein